LGSVRRERERERERERGREGETEGERGERGGDFLTRLINIVAQSNT
jgi:hypothetical protein